MILNNYRLDVDCYVTGGWLCLIGNGHMALLHVIMCTLINPMRASSPTRRRAAHPVVACGVYRHHPPKTGAFMADIRQRWWLVWRSRDLCVVSCRKCTLTLARPQRCPRGRGIIIAKCVLAPKLCCAQNRTHHMFVCVCVCLQKRLRHTHARGSTKI